MDDLARRTEAMAGFVEAHVAMRPSRRRCSGSAIPTAPTSSRSVIFARPGAVRRGGADASADPVRRRTPAPVADAGADHRRRARPDLPARATRRLEALVSRRRAPRSQSNGSPGGHEIGRSEIAAIARLPALDGGREKESRHGDRPERDRSRGKPAPRAATSTRADGDEADMTFTKAGEQLIIIDHTEVPDAFRGQGVGVALVARGGRGRARGGQEDHAALPVRGGAVPPAPRMGRRAARAPREQRHELEPALDPTCPTPRGRRDRDADHPARPRPRRLRGPPGAAGAEAADGRARSSSSTRWGRRSS